MTDKKTDTTEDDMNTRIDYATHRELRRARMSNAGFLFGIEGDPDLLFAADGTVRLPKLVSIAVAMARRSDGCLTRQPTIDRAEAVMEALADLIRDDETMEIRPGTVSESFGVYLVGA